uniref:Zn(2)-C6 fungal-type domain-containing protein n=1 Tax=Mycena chlorophos TaxID=658473 RepID=A0ABQ0LWA2_MYCCL|nr:predicted protein [Mycena chlorophos]
MTETLESTPLLHHDASPSPSPPPSPDGTPPSYSASDPASGTPSISHHDLAYTPENPAPCDACKKAQVNCEGHGPGISCLRCSLLRRLCENVTFEHFVEYLTRRHQIPRDDVLAGLLVLHEHQFNPTLDVSHVNPVLVAADAAFQYNFQHFVLHPAVDGVSVSEILAQRHLLFPPAPLSLAYKGLNGAFSAHSFLPSLLPAPAPTRPYPMSTRAASVPRTPTPSPAPVLADARVLTELLALRHALAAAAATADASAREQQLLELSRRFVAFCPFIPRLLNRDDLSRIVLGLRGAIINTSKALGRLPRDPAFRLIFDVAGRLSQIKLDSLRDAERRIEQELSQLGHQQFCIAVSQVQAWRTAALQNFRPATVKFEDGVKLEDRPSRPPTTPPSRSQTATPLVTVFVARELSTGPAIPVPVHPNTNPGPGGLNMLAAVASNVARPTSVTCHKRGLSIPELLGPEVLPKCARINSPSRVATMPAVAALQPVPAAIMPPLPPIALPVLPPIAVVAPARVPRVAPAPPPLYRPVAAPAPAAPALVPFPLPPAPVVGQARPGPGPLGFLASPWEQPALGMREGIARIDQRVAELLHERVGIVARYRRLTGDSCPIYLHSQSHLLAPAARARL